MTITMLSLDARLSACYETLMRKLEMKSLQQSTPQLT